MADQNKKLVILGYIQIILLALILGALICPMLCSSAKKSCSKSAKGSGMCLLAAQQAGSAADVKGSK